MAELGCGKPSSSGDGEGNGLTTGVDPRDRLIVALDTRSVDDASHLVEAVGDMARFFKVGSGLLADGGIEFARQLKSDGRRVFLDLKLFDIGATVERAARALCWNVAPDFLTVHGDPPVIRAAVDGRGDAPTRILAVSVLTSLNRADLDTAMIAPGSLSDIALERTRRAVAAGADGIVASPREVARLRAMPACEGRILVTPGVRPKGSESGDQKRIATPAEAIAAGANHIVVGRPILAAQNPRQVIESILEEIGQAGGGPKP